MKRILALLLTSATALVVTSAAFANSLTCGHGVTCNKGVFTSQPLGGNLGAHTTSGGGTLPFSGLNLATVAVIAALLIASGLTLRWATGRRS